MWIIIPDIILIDKSIDIIAIVSLNGLFLFSNTNNPSPALEHNPEITAPNPIAPLRYISVIAIEIAQLGISPIIAVIIGWSMESFRKYSPRCSSP